MAPQKSLKSIAQDKNASNPSQLGDPVSLKAETSDTEPTEHDRPNKAGRSTRGGQSGSLKKAAEETMKTNPTLLGDPVSLRAETSNTEPTENDRGALESEKGGSGKPKL